MIEIGDKLVCPKCEELSMHESQTKDNKYTMRWCSKCNYRYSYENKLMKD